MRYRLIPTRGMRAASWYVFGAEHDATVSAKGSYENTGTPVAVCKAPLDGIVNHIATFPSVREQRAAERAAKAAKAGAA